MPKAKKPPATAPIMDVARPGSSAPSPNAKHVIVNHRPMVGDPMVTPKKINVSDASADTEPTATPEIITEAKLPQPLLVPLPESLNEPEVPETAKPAVKPPAKAKKAKKPKAKPKPTAAPDPSPVTETAVEPVAEPEAEPPAEPSTEPDDKSDDEKIVDEPIQPTEPTEPAEPAEADKSKETEEPEKPEETKNDADAPEKTDDKTDEKTPAKPDPTAQADAEAAKQTEHDASIQKLVEAKQYFLPINSVEKRRSRRFVALGILLSILLAIAWVDVALDAGIIHINNVKPVTHFFSN